MTAFINPHRIIFSYVASGFPHSTVNFRVQSRAGSHNLSCHTSHTQTALWMTTRSTLLDNSESRVWGTGSDLSPMDYLR